MPVAHILLLIIRRLEYKAPSNKSVRYLYLPSLDVVQRENQWFLADITKSPIYNQGFMGSISPRYNQAAFLLNNDFVSPYTKVGP